MNFALSQRHPACADGIFPDYIQMVHAWKCTFCRTSGPQLMLQFYLQLLCWGCKTEQNFEHLMHWGPATEESCMSCCKLMQYVILVQMEGFLTFFCLFYFHSKYKNLVFEFLESWHESLLHKVVAERLFSPLDVGTHCFAHKSWGNCTSHHETTFDYFLN